MTKLTIHTMPEGVEGLPPELLKEATASMEAYNAMGWEEREEFLMKKTSEIAEMFAQAMARVEMQAQLLEGAENLVRQALEVILSDDAEARADFMRAHDKLFKLLEAAKGSIH